MAEDNRVDIDFALWSIIIRVRDLVFKARDNELNQYGITTVEARALYVINLIGEKATPAAISRSMLREHNTVTALLTRMQNKGLITRTKDPVKKNSWLIGLTEKGRGALQNVMKRETIYDAFSVLSKEEREQITQSLKKVSDQAFKLLIKVPTAPDRSAR